LAFFAPFLYPPSHSTPLPLEHYQNIQSVKAWLAEKRAYLKWNDEIGRFMFDQPHPES
jgi:hypothetical protein